MDALDPLDPLLNDVPPGEAVMIFIGVTTGGSRIHSIFPRWAAEMGIAPAHLRGLDLPLDVQADAVRSAVRWIARSDAIRGALVTTHKIAVHRHARDLFAGFDADADRLGEVNAIVKTPAGLAGHAMDTVTAGLALDRIVPRAHWGRNAEAEALVLGAGGAGLALAAQLTGRPARERPCAITLVDVDAGRLADAEAALRGGNAGDIVRVRQVSGADGSDALLAGLPARSLVVNATGLGKDRPGSPFSPLARFPDEAVVWEFNYRGPRDFLVQAQSQQAEQRLTVADGWTYFLYGWAHVMAAVFGVRLDDALFDRLERATEAER